MGNRAVITTAPYRNDNIAIYVHLNGGRASIEGFLQAAKELGYRAPGSDASYGLARLAQAIGLYFGAASDCSLGIGTCAEFDGAHADNGAYLIGGDWEIVGRKGYSYDEDVDPAKTASIAKRIVAITRAAQAFSDRADEED